MQSALIDELKLQYRPLAVLFTDHKPESALQLREGKWGCVMALYCVAMKKGKTVAFDRRSYGCIGAGVGLCLGNSYEDNRDFMQKLLADDEGYFANRGLVREFMDTFNYVDTPHHFVVFKPLEQIDLKRERPALISIPVNPDQLSALATLIKFRRPGCEHVAAPFCAGCQSVCVMPYTESSKEYPRAIIGNLDPSSRKILPADILTFTVPLNTFLEMQDDAPRSFLHKKVWEPIARRMT